MAMHVMRGKGSLEAYMECGQVIQSSDSQMHRIQRCYPGHLHLKFNQLASEPVQLRSDRRQKGEKSAN
jgi:hypothetical protein